MNINIVAQTFNAIKYSNDNKLNATSYKINLTKYWTKKPRD